MGWYSVDTILMTQSSDQWMVLAVMMLMITDDSSRARNFLSS
jgi:hypothetical protein